MGESHLTRPDVCASISLSHSVTRCWQLQKVTLGKVALGGKARRKQPTVFTVLLTSVCSTTGHQTLPWRVCKYSHNYPPPTLSTRAIWISLNSPRYYAQSRSGSACLAHFPHPLHQANSSFPFLRSHPEEGPPSSTPLEYSSCL